MQQVYEHEQPGTLTRVLTGSMTAMFAVISVQAFLSGNREGAMWMGVAAAICLLVAALFHSLTVRVAANDIQLWFGIGLIQKSFLTAEIQRASVVRNRWYYGWGIRMYPGGWLFNVSGLDAVEFELKNGRKYRIGTDQPQELHAAIESAMAGAGGPA